MASETSSERLPEVELSAAEKRIKKKGKLREDVIWVGFVGLNLEVGRWVIQRGWGFEEGLMSFLNVFLVRAYMKGSVGLVDAL
ncbi:hypothetical protein U1Q18_036615, partial [Sarracenia purpurea var. burkii]